QADKPEPPPLDYFPLRDEVRDRRMVAHAIVGSILTAILLVAGVVGTILLCMATDSDSIWIIPCLGALALFIWLSVVLYRNPRRRGWAIGLWIGVGLAMLIEG